MRLPWKQTTNSSLGLQQARRTCLCIVGQQGCGGVQWVTTVCFNELSYLSNLSFVLLSVDCHTVRPQSAAWTHCVPVRGRKTKSEEWDCKGFLRQIDQSFDIRVLNMFITLAACSRCDLSLSQCWDRLHPLHNPDKKVQKWVALQILFLY